MLLPNKWLRTPRLEADDVSGQVASSLQMARAYASLVEVTLGQEARRHEGLLPAGGSNWGLVASRMWSEVFANVMSTQDVEVVQFLNLGTSSSVWPAAMMSKSFAVACG